MDKKMLRVKDEDEDVRLTSNESSMIPIVFVIGHSYTCSTFVYIS